MRFILRGGYKERTHHVEGQRGGYKEYYTLSRRIQEGPRSKEDTRRTLGGHKEDTRRTLGGHKEDTRGGHKEDTRRH